MKRLVFLVPALLAARTASANQCPALQGQIVTPELPVGCPIVVYKDQAWNPNVPTGSIDRAGTYIPIEPTVISTETVNLDIYMETIDASCVEFHGYETRPWDRMSLDPGAVQVGDVVRFYSAYPDVTIVAAGPCPEPGVPSEYLLYCQSPIQDYWACEDDPDDPNDPNDPNDPGNLGDDTAGCNAGGGLGLAAIALLAGLRRRRATAPRRS